MLGQGKVVCIDSISELSSNDIYIGRKTDKLNGLPASKYANPYSDGSKFERVAKFSTWLKKQLKEKNITERELADLFGKNLVCHCKTVPCHGYVLLSEINRCYCKLHQNGELK